MKESSMVELNAPNHPRWMVVDDNPEYLLLLRKVVRLYTGRELECFEQSQAALAAFEANPEQFEFVITDLEMPEMDGLEFCRRLRAISPSLKILLVTGSGLLEEETAAQKGFCGLLRKPFPITALAHVLASAGLGNELVKQTFQMAI